MADQGRRGKKAAKRTAKKAVRKQARRAGKAVMSKANAMFRAIASGPKNRTEYRRMKDVIKAFGAEGARQQIGVSKKTWRDWNHPDRKKRKKPNAANQRKIDGLFNTVETRRASVSRKRAKELDQLVANGGEFSMTGDVGPADPQYKRFRTIAMKLDRDAASDLMQVWYTYGPDAAHDALMDMVATRYFDERASKGRVFVDDITDYLITPSSGDSDSGSSRPRRGDDE